MPGTTSTALPPFLMTSTTKQMWPNGRGCVKSVHVVSWLVGVRCGPVQYLVTPVQLKKHLLKAVDWPSSASWNCGSAANFMHFPCEATPPYRHTPWSTSSDWNSECPGEGRCDAHTQKNDVWSWSCQCHLHQQHPHPAFYRPDALPLTQRAVSKHWRQLFQNKIFF